MKTKIFTVYDQVSKAHHVPFFLPNEGAGKRQFADWINSDNNPYGKHPEDYSLLEIGEFDDETAEITKLETPISHGLGVKFLAPTE